MHTHRYMTVYSIIHKRAFPSFPREDHPTTLRAVWLDISQRDLRILLWQSIAETTIKTQIHSGPDNHCVDKRILAIIPLP